MFAAISAPSISQVHGTRRPRGRVIGVVAEVAEWACLPSLLLIMVLVPLDDRVVRSFPAIG